MCNHLHWREVYLSDAAKVSQAFAVWYLVVPETPPPRTIVVGCPAAASQSPSRFAEASQQPLLLYLCAVAQAPYAPYYAVAFEQE